MRQLPSHIAASVLATALAATLPAQDTLVVRQVLPEGDLRPSSVITIGFNRPLAGTLERLRDPSTVARVTPSLAARIEWRDPVTLRIVPNEPLRPGSRYTVTIDTTLVAPDGSRLASAWRREFTVQPPQLAGSWPPLPPNGMTTLGPDTRLLLRFSGDVDSTDLARTVRLVPLEGTPAVCAAVGVSVKVRPPAAADPWSLQYGQLGVRDAVDQRFDRVVELTPLRELPPSCQYALHLPLIDEGQRTQLRYRVQSGPPLTMTAGCADAEDCASSRQLVLQFTAPVELDELRERVRFEPGGLVTLPDTGAVRQVWALPFVAEPGSRLRVTVDERLRDVHRRVISGIRTFEVAVGDRVPNLSSDDGLMTLSRAGAPVLRLRHLNVESVEVTVFRMREDRAMMAVRSPRAVIEATSGMAHVTSVVDLAGQLNEERTSDIPLRLPSDEWRRSVLVTRVRLRSVSRQANNTALRIPADVVSRRTEWMRQQGAVRAVQMTDLMAHAQAGVTGGGVLVTDVRSGAPVTNATVQLLDDDHRVVATARTGRDGLVRLSATRRPVRIPGSQGDGIDGVPSLSDWQPYRSIAGVVIRQGTDKSWTPVAEGPVTDGRGRMFWPGQSPVEHRATIHTDRGIYRPGEHVYFHAVVRDGWLHAMTAPVSTQARWRVFFRDPHEERPRVLLERVFQLSAFGTGADSLLLPQDASLGGYTVRLERRLAGRWAIARETEFQVAEYRAPEFAVTAALNRALAERGDTLRADIAARLLFDAPLANAPVTWRARFTELHPWELRIPGLGSDWTVGRTNTWWDPEPQANERFLNGQSTTNGTGVATLALPTDSADFALGARLQLDVGVTDVSGQVVTASSAANVAATSHVVAAQTEGTSWIWRAGSRYGVRVGVVRLDGTWSSGVRVTSSLVRRRWVTVQETYGPRWEQRSDTVHRDSIVTRDSSAVVFAEPTAEGYHELHLTAVDERGRTSTTTIGRYATGRGQFVWGEDETRLPLFVDRDSVNAGDVVTLQFDSPFERAHAWVSVGRETLLWQERRDVARGSNTLTLRVPESWIPNVQVALTLVRQSDLTETDSLAQRYRHGVADLTVDREPRRLQVLVRPAASEHRPGDTAAITVQVRDQRGRGVRGSVVVWAADEGVLALTGYETPDPSAELLRPVGSIAGFSSTLTSLMRELERLQRRRQLGEEPLALEQVVVTGAAMADSTSRIVFRRTKTAEAPGALQNARSDFRSTAFYRAAIVTDADGRAIVRVKLPDNLTTFRVMAVAVDARDRSGTGATPLIVTKPLLVRAALPRFVRPGDLFSAGGVVNTRLQGTRQVEVVARGGAAVSLSGAVRQTVDVGVEGRLARFNWSATPGTSARVTLGVTSGALQDALTVTLPVRPDQHPRAEALVALVRDTATMEFTLPGDIDPVRSRLVVRAGPTPLPVIRAWESWFRVYPHSCTEQLVSAGRTLVALLQLHAAGGTRLADAAELRSRLATVADLIVKRQGGDGSFGYWSAESWSTPWLTEYAGALLLDARDLDVAVPPGVIQRVSAYLQGWLTEQPALPADVWGTRAEQSRQVAEYLSHRLAALDFLSRTGNTNLLATVVSEAPRLTWEDRARLAEVLSRHAEHRGAARAQLDRLWSTVTMAGNRVDLPDSALQTVGFPSHIRPAARLLRATQALEPQHPRLGPLVQRILQRERAERAWVWNTLDYAYAAGAAASFIREASGGRGTFTVSGAGGPLLTGTPAGAVRQDSTDLSRLTTPAGDSTRVSLRVRTDGSPVYVTATVYVVQRETPVRPESRGLMVERSYERFADGQPVTELQEGDLVRVRLRVTAPTDREFVAVEDPLPAGLEAVDTKLRTSSLSPFVERPNDASSRVPPRGGFNRWDWYQWNPWEHSAMYDDRVVFYARTLGRGSHELTYVARATTTGRFVRPQAHAEEMYNPALNGRSDAGAFVVRAR